MGTVNKQVADEIVAGKYDCDKPVSITKYTNHWGGESYGVIFEGEIRDRYKASEYIINPVLYWSRDGAHK